MGTKKILVGCKTVPDRNRDRDRGEEISDIDGWTGSEAYRRRQVEKQGRNTAAAVSELKSTRCRLINRPHE